MKTLPLIRLHVKQWKGYNDVSKQNSDIESSIK